MRDAATSYRYWGKSDRENNYHLLVYHCLDVAAVGKVLSQRSELFKQMSDFLEIDESTLQSTFQFFLAIHDLGKFAGSFQNLCADFNEIDHETHKYSSEKAKHDKLGFGIWKEVLKQLKDDPEHQVLATLDLKVWLHFIFAHHGMPVNRVVQECLEHYYTSENVAAATEYVLFCLEQFKPQWKEFTLKDKLWQKRMKQLSFSLSGLTILADWLGSKREVFSYQSELEPLENYYQQAQLKAKALVEQLDLTRSIERLPFDSIKAHFGYEPTPLQQWAETVEIKEGPNLFILEDVTGAGKTEAALALTHRLIESGEADGFYFGLPTMATANALFERIKAYYQKMFTLEGKKASIVLAHSANQMMRSFWDILNDSNTHTVVDSYAQDDESVSGFCNRWFIDSKKTALLSPAGVGTIDQPLLAVLPRKHQSLRFLGLYRKVLIFDEIHAADTYMFALLENLIKIHASQGGSIILLSATLPKARRAKLVSLWQETITQESSELLQLKKAESFPLATHVAQETLTETSFTPQTPPKNSVKNIIFLHDEERCIETILHAIKEGKCVVWVRNTVAEAQKAYQRLQNEISPDQLTLFHSRFALIDRFDIEKKVLQIFGKKSSHSERMGQVLIATQVFQESLDADCDLMISDLCPIDHLIQRAGRLHRHCRDKQGKVHKGNESREIAKLYIHAPVWQEEPDKNWLKTEPFLSTSMIYRSPSILWRTQKILQEKMGLNIYTDLRELVETVYDETMPKPDAFIEEEALYFSSESQKENQADLYKIKWEEGYCHRATKLGWTGRSEDYEISTRYSDLEYVDIVLVRLDKEGDLELYHSGDFPIENSKVKLEKRRFSDRLESPSHDLVERFIARYPCLKYQKLWNYLEASDFSYDKKIGVVNVENK